MSNLNDWKKVYHQNSQDEWREMVNERQATIRTLKAENAARGDRIVELDQGNAELIVQLFNLEAENAELRETLIRRNKKLNRLKQQLRSAREKQDG